MKLSTITIDGVRYVRAKSLLGEAAAIERAIDIIVGKIGMVSQVEGEPEFRLIAAAVARMRESGGES